MAFIRNIWRVRLFTRKVRVAAQSARKNGTIRNASTERLKHGHPHQPEDHHVQPPRQGPSEVLQIVVVNDGAETDPEQLISIKEKLEQAHRHNEERPWEKLSIYRIPHSLKHGEDKAYVPQIVSLGPYHHGKKRLRQMDQHKWRCLDRILSRTNHQIDLYLHSVKQVEKRARACYEGTISMSSPEFVEMMVLDGCFVIELFRGFNEGFETLGYLSNEPVFSMQGPMHMIQRDMIMLENQIPFFILNRLYCLQLGQLGHPDLEKELALLALLFFDHMKPTDATNHSNRLDFPLSDQNDLHCLALFRQSLLHPGVKQEEHKDPLQRQQQLVHCVTELRQVGIKFSRKKTDKFWDIHFEDGSLKIPRLVIHDGTRSLFLNLIAFEQCHFKYSNDSNDSKDSNDITSYVVFMDNLINSPKDIRHLHDRGIIEHWLGSNTEVADLFNGLCQEVVFDINSSYLSKVSAHVTEYSCHRRHGWAFLFKHKYFGNPWSIISFIAALVLLLLTFTQTFYAVYSYHRPGS
ncbi:UPF0481 protein At3g47200 [Eucalyptus grandis]|uniref:UPF0481 protein At3g47200 n=1 Tax=Eucalyptus grandis TaxID=71139 RepID=UPI00192F023E|nr:UPF0481 protein At3g47200 [Eucalyptus grandis]